MKNIISKIMMCCMFLTSINLFSSAKFLSTECIKTRQIFEDMSCKSLVLNFRSKKDFEPITLESLGFKLLEDLERYINERESHCQTLSDSKRMQKFHKMAILKEWNKISLYKAFLKYGEVQ